MSEEHIVHYLCIGCPLGCHLEVEEDEDDNIVEVRGWACKRGENTPSRNTQIRAGWSRRRCGYTGDYGRVCRSGLVKPSLKGR